MSQETNDVCVSVQLIRTFTQSLPKRATPLQVAKSQVFKGGGFVALWSAYIRKTAKDHKSYGSASAYIRKTAKDHKSYGSAAIHLL